ncbi:hypothetical protein ACFYRC_36460 [Streptomyces sp. NPDC005279]|uniref:hypothetical protein n=1 Tax=Streptomyces sp. NPDC005279 TaxID=3364712 RepID=UPI0036AB2C35
MRVTYITAWTAESVPQPKVIRLLGRGGEGIGYADEESLIDRRHKALWIRTDHAQGRVRPDFARVNSLRQKRAMRFSLCQVCGGAATRADGRALHLMGAATLITEGETTAAHPVHPACAVESIENCPFLRRIRRHPCPRCRQGDPVDAGQLHRDQPSRRHRGVSAGLGRHGEPGRRDRILRWTCHEHT